MICTHCVTYTSKMRELLYHKWKDPTKPVYRTILISKWESVPLSLGK